VSPDCGGSDTAYCDRGDSNEIKRGKKIGIDEEGRPLTKGGCTFGKDQ